MQFLLSSYNPVILLHPLIIALMSLKLCGLFQKHLGYKISFIVSQTMRFIRYFQNNPVQ